MKRTTTVVGCLAVLVICGACTPGSGADGTMDSDATPASADLRATPYPEPSPALQKGSERWRLHRGNPDAIEAFTSQASGVPATRVGLMVSTSESDYRVVAYRIGHYDGGTGHRVWTSPTVGGRKQGGPRFSSYETRTVVAPWTSDLTVDTAGWRPGLYVLKLRTGTGWEAQVPYVVSSRSAYNRVALVAPVTTWQAYNRWGGYSLYWSKYDDRRSWAVSFDRPYVVRHDPNDYRKAMVPAIVHAEGLGIPLAYFTNLDVHARPGVLDGARGYVSIGHDEYWTPRMRRIVLDARAAGTNLAFFGANTMYWRIRLEQAQRLVVGYRGDAWRDPVRDSMPWATTARFRDHPVPRPENDLVGMQYECYPVAAAYRVVSPGWWGFRGTGVRRGTSFDGLVGNEADRVYPDQRTPRPLQVLSNSTYSCRGVTTTSQSVYYTTPSGAGVFAAGTLRWVCAIDGACSGVLGRGTPRFVRIVTANLLRGFSAGPVGMFHPAHDNVREFDLPLANGVSAS